MDKLERNRARDNLQTRALEEAGWTVLRAWEHEPIHDVVERVRIAANGSRAYMSEPATRRSSS
jgi:DNA mismatch endonuclease (patch repair protein)